MKYKIIIGLGYLSIAMLVVPMFLFAGYFAITGESLMEITAEGIARYIAAVGVVLGAFTILAYIEACKEERESLSLYDELTKERE